MPNRIRTESNKYQSEAFTDAALPAVADEPRERFDTALKVIRHYKTQAELDAEAQAEARLKKAQSAFGSKE